MTFRKLFTASVAALVILASSLAHASSPHTWVAYWGSDSNLGTQTSPFGDFQTAVSNTTAGGIVSVLTPGDYGAVTINQPITIEGVDGAGLTFTGADGISITISTPSNATVILRNLTVNGLGTGEEGIVMNQAGNLIIDHCHIEGFTDKGVSIYSVAPVSVVIRDTVIQGGAIGVRTFQSSGGVAYDRVLLQNVTIQGATSAGVFSRNGNMEIVKSAIIESHIGLEADTSAAINVSSSAIYGNATAIAIYTTGTIRLNDNDIYSNPTGIAPDGGTIASAGNNRTAGSTTNTAPGAKITLE